MTTMVRDARPERDNRFVAEPQDERAPEPPLVTRAALGEPRYLPGGSVFLPVVTVLDVRGGGQ